MFIVRYVARPFRERQTETLVRSRVPSLFLSSCCSKFFVFRARCVLLLSRAVGCGGLGHTKTIKKYKGEIQLHPLGGSFISIPGYTLNSLVPEAQLRHRFMYGKKSGISTTRIHVYFQEDELLRFFSGNALHLMFYDKFVFLWFGFVPNMYQSQFIWFKS